MFTISQGSEFQHTALLLPPTPNPILIRAREWLTLIEAKRGVLNGAVVRKVMKLSGVGS